jgi:hypothetical protein
MGEVKNAGRCYAVGGARLVAEVHEVVDVVRRCTVTASSQEDDAWQRNPLHVDPNWPRCGGWRLESRAVLKDSGAVRCVSQ